MDHRTAPAVLRLVSASGDQMIDLRPGRTVVVGRSLTSSAPVTDPTGTVSRLHAEIFPTATGVRVKDRNSANGTFLNGARVTECEARPGDVITFGKAAFRVKEVSAPTERAPLPWENPAATPPGTIVRRLPVPAAGALPAMVARRGAGRDEKLGRLLEIAMELSQPQDLDTLLGKVVDLTFRIMSVDRIAILLLDAQSGDLVPRVSRAARGEDDAARPVPRSILREAIEGREAILSHDAGADGRFNGSSIVLQGVRSAMCLPLLGSGRDLLGILYVDNQTATGAFTDEDLDFLVGFGGLTALAIENARLAERVRREAVVLSNFQRYFAPDLVAQIARHEDAVRLGGDKRPVVVLFSDIRGFTRLSETMGPDDIATLLTEYFTEMVEIVFAHGGTLDKFMGDAMMALWGAPIAREDDAERAMRCATEQLDALEQLNARWTAQGRPALRVGIGINRGEVFAGNIGSDRRLEYTVIGDAVNTASRLCSLAGPNEILISEAFYRALRQPPEVEALRASKVKGKSRPVAVYRVKRSVVTPLGHDGPGRLRRGVPRRRRRTRYQPL
ncbi:MAG: adenylate/guanylate cyclase domain-containing protein [Gemmatimonadales bacterium]